MKRLLTSLLVMIASYLVEAWAPNVACSIRTIPYLKSTRCNLHSDSHAALGIPQHLASLQVGENIQGLAQDISLEKVSNKPPIFVLRNVLSSSQCESLAASVAEFEPAKTKIPLNDDVKRKLSSVGWLDNALGSITHSLAKECHQILLPNQTFDSDRGVEPMQVVRYEEHGEYILHHDSNQRLLTVLYYLNGQGETWFPLADGADEYPTNLYEALESSKQKDPADSGVLVSCEGRGVQVQQGDAVAFFNYFEDGSVNWKSIHAGLPTSSPKLVANHWYRHFPFSFI
mmetsp:Transcript_34750/g.72325  ORF Transcript_34750/g.72325 Transcript_34750/m.72325 type:complete len:286 (-) Transcript_34750:210-1067(-)